MSKTSSNTSLNKAQNSLLGGPPTGDTPGHALVGYGRNTSPLLRGLLPGRVGDLGRPSGEADPCASIPAWRPSPTLSAPPMPRARRTWNPRR